MAGEGSRFKNDGWTTPKPLIMLDGQPLFMHAVKSISNAFSQPIKYSFIVKDEHIINDHIDNVIYQYLPHASIYSVSKTTRGAAETCMIARDNIDDDDCVLILDCDLAFSSDSYISLINQVLFQDAGCATGGCLLSFKSKDDRYSYALTDHSGMVIKTAEKQVISDNALCGAYFFSKGQIFKDAADELISNPLTESKEFYISLLYNKIIAKNYVVKLAHTDTYKSFGTPQELRQFS